MDKLNCMEAFVRVVDAGSFSGAARRWDRSKAVVSKYISTLEAELGVELLRRTTRSLSLTEAGRAYHARCVDVLAEIEATESALREDHRAPRGNLRITAPPGFVSRYGVLMTTSFIERYPGITLELELTHRMVDLVEEGFDLAIRVTAPRDSSLVARRLGPAPVIAVASPCYLAKRGVPEQPKDLKTHDCLVDTNFRERGRWRFVDGQRVDVSGPIRANSPTLICDLAVAGHGIALTPRFIAAPAIERGALREVLQGQVALGWSVYAMYSRRRFVSGRVRAFIEHMAGGLAGDA